MHYMYFLFVCLIVTFVATVVTCIARINTHKCKREKYEKIIIENLKSKDLRDFFLILCERSYDYIRVFFIFQGIAKSVNGLSLLFTVSSVILTAFGDLDYTIFGLSCTDCQVLVSAISVIFVCIIIYINPTKRASQYLECWRNTDKNIVKLIASLQNSGKEESDVPFSNYEDLQKFAKICADDLSNREFEITSDEE